MSIPFVGKKVSFAAEPLKDDRNPKPLFQSDTDQFTALLRKYTASKQEKDDPKIKAIASKKLIEFVMAHPDYRDLIPKELNDQRKH